MVVWEARGYDEGPKRQYSATKKGAVAWSKLLELEGVEINKIVVKDRWDLALQLNFLADLMNV
jgi:hypothetical protein